MPPARRSDPKRGLHGVREVWAERLQGVFKELRGEGHLTDYHLEQALRRDPALPARGGRGPARGPEVHREGQGKGGRGEGDPTALASPGSHANRARRADGAARWRRVRRRPRANPRSSRSSGLQGSGKTTSAAKLARHLKTRGRYPLVVAADLARPAAVPSSSRSAGRSASRSSSPGGTPIPSRSLGEGCARLGRRVATRSSSTRRAGSTSTTSSCAGPGGGRGRRAAGDSLRRRCDDGAGRGALGRGVRRGARLTGIILTKTDGDARGGAALTVVTTTGKPIKLVASAKSPRTSRRSTPIAWPRGSWVSATSSR